MEEDVRDQQPRVPVGGAPPDKFVLVFSEDAVTNASLAGVLAQRFGYRVHRSTDLDEAVEIFSTVWIHLVIVAVRDRTRGLDQLRAFLDPRRGRSAPIMIAVDALEGGDHLEYLREGADDAVPFLCPEGEILARADRLVTRESRRQRQVMSRQYAFAGDLGRAGFTNLVMLVEHGAMTGSLELHTPRGAAQLLFKGGQVTHASFANLGGRVAFFELLREREGQFEFVPSETVDGDKRCAVEGTNTSLLLEGSQANDENPYRSATIDGRRSHVSTGTVARALAPDRRIADLWLDRLRQGGAPGQVRLLASDQVREWTQLDPGQSRLRLALVTDVPCGVHVLTQMAAPVAEGEIAHALQRSPSSLGFTWRASEGETLEILLLDQQRLNGVADCVRCCPAVLILAPSYGDFLTFNMSARTVLQRLIQRAPPHLVLGVGNAAFAGQLRSFAKLAKIDPPVRLLTGSLWKLAPRTLLQEAIRHWGALPAQPGARAA